MLVVKIPAAIPAGLTVLTVLTGAGCDLLRPRTAVTIEQRLSAHYGDLADAPFAVIADFERIEQAELVRSTGPTASTPVLSERGGVAATGVGCVRFTLASPDDALILSDATATHAKIERDWREFDLLIANVNSPRDDLAVELTLTAAAKTSRPVENTGNGPPDATTSSVKSRMLLRSGWNVLRIDLTEAGERLALDDVRELRWSVPEAGEPVELRLDDIVVVSNRKDLFGSAANATGELYVQRQGRRWNVGAGGRFELGFSQGQIVAWYDLSSDPGRVRNLIGGGALGPIPVIVPSDAERGFQSPHAPDDVFAGGSSIAARQRVIEMSRVRVVVESDWRFVPAGGTPSDSSPYHRWRWCIYPSGQIYASVESSPHAADAADDEDTTWGVVFTTSDVPDERVYLHPTAQLEDPDDLRRTSFAAVCPGDPDGCGLLIVPSDGREGPQVSAIHNTRERQLHLLFSGGASQSDAQRWRFLLSLWPEGNAAPKARESRALVYTGAGLGGPVELTIGTAASNRPGDRDHDGFDEGQGCYAVTLDANRVRLTFDARQRSVDWPVFCASGVSSDVASVYVDQAILSDRHMADDADGNLIFHIPATLSGRHLIEVYRHTSARP